MLTAHTDTIETKVRTILNVSRKVADECTIVSIKADIEASLSMIEALSHQLCQVTKVKLKNCKG